MKTTWKKRCTEGFLAVLLGCFSLLAGGSSAFAAPLEQTDVKEETQAEDITIEQGDTYEITRKIIVKKDAEPDGANIDTSALKEEEGVLFSVVPSSMEQAKEKASLVQGERIVYPSDLD